VVETRPSHDLESYGPTLINELVNRLDALDLPEESKQKIVSLVPELRVFYGSAVDEMFDRYAKAGGVEA